MKTDERLLTAEATGSESIVKILLSLLVAWCLTATLPEERASAQVEAEILNKAIPAALFGPERKGIKIGKEKWNVPKAKKLVVFDSQILIEGYINRDRRLRGDKRTRYINTIRLRNGRLEYVNGEVPVVPGQLELTGNKFKDRSATLAWLEDWIAIEAYRRFVEASARADARLRRVNIRTLRGRYWASELGSENKEINANRREPRTWEDFWLYDMNGPPLRDRDEVLLVGANNHQVRPVDCGRGKLRSNGRPWTAGRTPSYQPIPPQDWWFSMNVDRCAVFTIVKRDGASGGSLVGDDTRVGLRTKDGRFVSAVGMDGPVQAEPKQQRDWETFVLTTPPQDRGTVKPKDIGAAGKTTDTP